jgi:hypothetical protein
VHIRLILNNSFATAVQSRWRNDRSDDGTITADHNAVRQTGALITAMRDFVFVVTVGVLARKTLENFQENDPNV